MADQTVAVICAAPGTGLGKAVGKLVDWLGVKYQVAWADVESILCNEVEEVREAMRGVGAPAEGSISMRDITHHLPRTAIMKLWGSAAGRSMRKLKAKGPEVRILSCHLTCYGATREEIYTVARPSLFVAEKGVKVSRVMMLIDDLPDMFRRLSENGQLYDPRIQFRDYLRSQAQADGYDKPEDLNPDVIADLLLRWRTAAFRHLLSWREHEMVRAEALAAELNAKFLIFGVKHLLGAAAEWVTSAVPKTVYISHPITRFHRNRQIAAGDWSDAVYQVNRVAEVASNRGVTLVMPAAIDELRFQQSERGLDGSLSVKSPLLNERWPLVGEADQLLYSPPEDRMDVNSNDILVSTNWQSGMPGWLTGIGQPSDPRYVDALVRPLDDEIHRAVASRDYALVTYTSALLIFRPWAEEPRWSGGVGAELGYLVRQLINLGEENRRMAFVHHTEDVLQFLQAKFDDDPQEFRRFFNLKRTKAIADANGMDEQFAEAILSEIVGGKLPGIYETSIDARLKERVIAQLPQLNTSAKVMMLQDWLRSPIVNLGVQYERSPIWMFSSENELLELLPEIISFLCSEGTHSSNWTSYVDEVWPDVAEEVLG